MRRPVDVKGYLLLSQFVSDVFLRPDIRRFEAGEAAVKAERSEFIWSLDGRPASHSWVIRAKENTRMLLSRPVFTTLEPGLSCRPPFHPHSL